MWFLIYQTRLDWQNLPVIIIICLCCRKKYNIARHHQYDIFYLLLLTDLQVKLRLTSLCNIAMVNYEKNIFLATINFCVFVGVL